MAVLRFSRRAELDLMEIARYTLERWGEDQAVRYIDALEVCCWQLARNPGLGRACDDIRPGLRRMESGQHVVFYRTAYWLAAFSISACSPNGTRLRTKRTDQCRRDSVIARCREGPQS